MQVIVTFNSFFYIGCLQFKSLHYIAVSWLQFLCETIYHLSLGKQFLNILEVSVIIFIKCDG